MFRLNFFICLFLLFACSTGVCINCPRTKVEEPGVCLSCPRLGITPDEVKVCLSCPRIFLQAEVEDLNVCLSCPRLFLQHSTHLTASKPELKHRYKLFRQNLQQINKVNGQELGWTAGVNQFTDLSDEELMQFKGANMTARDLPQHSDNLGVCLNCPRVADAVDWRVAGTVTPVQDQGRCGSCWIFAAVAAIETRAFAAGSPKNGLSEQELVDCGSPYRDACQGGDSLKAFEYVYDNQRLAKRSDYPYLAKTGACMTLSNGLSGVTQRYYTYRYGEEQMIQGLNEGPIVVEFNAIPNFFRYQGGVFDDKSCSANQ